MEGKEVTRVAGRACGARVHRVPRVQRGRFLGLTGPMGRRVLKFDGPLGRGWWYRPAGDKYKVSVTGFTFSVIWYDKHSADWLAALASPYPASPDFHLKVKRLTMICASLALLQIMFAVHPRESVSHDSQVASLPYESCSLATPMQGQNKTPRNTFFISGSTVSTGCCVPLKRGQGGGARHQRGISLARRAVVKVLS